MFTFLILLCVRFFDIDRRAFLLHNCSVLVIHTHIHVCICIYTYLYIYICVHVCEYLPLSLLGCTHQSEQRQVIHIYWSDAKRSNGVAGVICFCWHRLPAIYTPPSQIPLLRSIKQLLWERVRHFLCVLMLTLYTYWGYINFTNKFDMLRKRYLRLQEIFKVCNRFNSKMKQAFDCSIKYRYN